MKKQDNKTEKEKEKIKIKEKEEIKKGFQNLFDFSYTVISKEHINSMSAFKKYSIYFISTLIIFFLMLVKLFFNIITFRWCELRYVFTVTGVYDELIKEYLEI